MQKKFGGRPAGGTGTVSGKNWLEVSLAQRLSGRFGADELSQSGTQRMAGKTTGLSAAPVHRERPEQLSNAAVAEIPLNVLIKSLPNRFSKRAERRDLDDDYDEFRFR